MSELDASFRKEMINTDRPIPGESLTASPDQNAPFLQPPVFTKKTEALEHYFELFTSEEVYDKLMTAIEQQVPLLDITKTILIQGFQEGLINPDMLLILVEPMVYMLASLAERLEIDFVIEQDDEDDISALGQAVGIIGEPEIGEEFPEDVLEQLESPEPIANESLLNRPEEQGPSLLGAR